MKTTERRAHYQITFTVLTVGVGAYPLLQSLVTPVLPLSHPELALVPAGTLVGDEPE
jgi:hypothetical protein